MNSLCNEIILNLALGDKWALTILDTEDEGYFLEFGLVGPPQHLIYWSFYAIGGSANVRTYLINLSYKQYFRNYSGTRVFHDTIKFTF